MNRFNLIILFMLSVNFVFATEKIVEQKRKGPILIVTYETGRIETNNLFLSISPAVKKEIARIEKERLMLQTLKSVVADTKNNITETSRLEDIEVAMLYLSQMKKDAMILSANSSSNTIEYLIGAGMRQDLNATKGKNE